MEKWKQDKFVKDLQTVPKIITYRTHITEVYLIVWWVPQRKRTCPHLGANPINRRNISLINPEAHAYRSTKSMIIYCLIWGKKCGLVLNQCCVNRCFIEKVCQSIWFILMRCSLSTGSGSDSGTGTVIDRGLWSLLTSYCYLYCLLSPI